MSVIKPKVPGPMISGTKFEYGIFSFNILFHWNHKIETLSPLCVSVLSLWKIDMQSPVPGYRLTFPTNRIYEENEVLHKRLFILCIKATYK